MLFRIGVLFASALCVGGGPLGYPKQKIMYEYLSDWACTCYTVLHESVLVLMHIIFLQGCSVSGGEQRGGPGELQEENRGCHKKRLECLPELVLPQCCTNWKLNTTTGHCILTILANSCVIANG